VRSSTEALEFMQNQSIDLLITEWVLKPLDGVELVRQVRLAKNSINRGVPIIMLTGRGEAVDVQTARDAGITEFLVKPFDIRALYERLEHVVEKPRWFVISHRFVGPDRRRRAALPEVKDQPDRRRNKPLPMKKQGGGLPGPGEPPVIMAPDFELRRLMGLTGPLSEVITADVLAQAQKAIDLMQDEAMQWIKQDLTALEAAYGRYKADRPAAVLEEIQMAALSLKSRAGVFGYQAASEIAQLFYAFLRQKYHPDRASDNEIMLKCLEALKVVFAMNIKAHNQVTRELVSELRRTVNRP